MKHKRTPKQNLDAPPSQPPSTTAMDPTDSISATTFNSSDDICGQLMTRYATSSAAQHRHLLATAAALKSLLLEDSLSLSPLSYFGAALDALARPSNDAVSSAAIATLLSIALPLVPEAGIEPEKAAEAVDVLVKVLEEQKKVGESTATVKCVVKCLGVLLGFCDRNDWDSVKLPFQTLLHWSIDKRPKVRKCALEYLESALKSFESKSVRKKASKLILTLLESYMSLAIKLGSESGKNSEAEHSDVAHVLSVTRVALPYLSDKICVEVVRKLIGLLDARFSALSRIVLNANEAFLDKVDIEVINLVAGDIISALSSYVSSKGNPKDSVIYAANLLKSALDKIHAEDAGKWNKSLPPALKAIAGLLNFEDEIASQASNILTNVIHRIESQPVTAVAIDDPESHPIASICSVFMNLLDSCARIPNEHTLAVLSVLFLKLGGNSSICMRNIVLKLAKNFIHAAGDTADTIHLQKCFGCAVVAMGAENVLSIVPISFSAEKMACSNTWLLPILKEYVVGASLGYFMEHLVPIAESLQRAPRKVKKSVTGQDLQAHARDIWGLLPAFCRLPTDISQSYQSFAKLMLVRLEEDTSMHEDIAAALQELVKQNMCLLESDGGDVEPTKHSSGFLIESYLLEKRRLHCYSKKAASKNTKVMSSYSPELLQALMNLFLASSPEKRSSLKKAINCLASVCDSSITKKILASSLERFPLLKALAESGGCDLSNTSLNDTSCESSSMSGDAQWCLILNLASSVLEGADEDLVDLIFSLTKHALQAGEGSGVGEAYSTLSCILEEHPWFCSSKMDELVDLLIGLKSPADIGTLSNRLSSLQILLVHALKNNSDAEVNSPFLILNEIITTLKDSKEETRKAAYDVLLSIGSSLGGSSAADPDGPHYRLISMILGYLSGPSPHITSAAVSALSVLVFKEPELCLLVPDVVPSVTSLLQTKAIEVIKAALGFIKVLVSCLEPEDLQNFVSVIIDGVIPWSSVSRHHFRTKVTVILEIMIRKCGFPTIKLATPERYQSFIKKVSLNRHGKTGDSADTKPEPSNPSTNWQKKRGRNETHNEASGSELHRNKRWKQNQDSHSPGGARSGGGRDKRVNRFNHTKSTMGDRQGNSKIKRGTFGQHRGRDGEFGKHRKREGDFSKHSKGDGEFGKNGKRDGKFSKHGKGNGEFGKHRKRDGEFGKNKSGGAKYGRKER